MKRILCSAAVVLAFALACSQSASAQHKASKLSKQQLLTLIATAETPAQHRRIAEYYEAEAKDFQAQAKDHEAQGDAYKKNPIMSNSKFKTDTVDHCDYFVKSLNDDAAKAEELAKMHEEMAKDAEKK